MKDRNLAGFAPRAALSALAAVLVALACLWASATAAASVPSRGASLAGPALGLSSSAGHHPDTVVRGRRLGRAHSRATAARAFPVAGGQSVEIFSTHYSEADMQAVADVLGGLVHGDEMNTLSAYLASPDELSYICGQAALACYAPALGEMIVSGVNGSAYGVPRDYTIAHEYGHHVANNRLNSPWAAIDSGAKRWATYERVCQGVRRGMLHPGDEGYHYWENPGEGFAEATARLNFPGVQVPWGYSSMLEPNRAALLKLRADILHPWTGPTGVTWNGSIWPGRRNPPARRFSTPLDGEVLITLDGPEGANYDLYVLGEKVRLSRRQAKRLRRQAKRLVRRHGSDARKRIRHKRRRLKQRTRRRVLRRGASVGSDEQIQMSACGRQSLRVEVRRQSGSGPFSVTVTRP